MHEAPPKHVADGVDAVLAHGHFYVAHGLELTCACVDAEELSWEIFRGRLLDPAHTREQKLFRSWNVHLVERGQPSPEPVVSVKWDRAAGQLHITRGLLCYVWEAYDAGNNVILTRETTKWVRELVGTISEEQFPNADDLRREIADRVFRAVVGTSRLPLNPIEAPLPVFSLGQLAFFDEPDSSKRVVRSFQELIRNSLSRDWPCQHAAKLLEFVLRIVRPDEVREATRLFAECWTNNGKNLTDLPRLFRTMFNEVSLSPYTNFVDNALAFLHALVEQGSAGIEDQIDLLSYLLRQLCRHLTAYDLIAFHHRGANYPDALLLDAVLKAFLNLIDEHAGLFSSDDRPSRLRRRALRQACLLRRFYEGHLVPDAPTSPGENARVLPPPHVRVPEEQLLQPLKRRKQLYAGDPTLELLGPRARATLRESLHDLEHADELRELGMAIFIDRPLGHGKAPGEPDQTPLLSHEAFSRSIAERRLSELSRFDERLPLGALRNQLGALPVKGFPAADVALPGRPVVSLADARRVADDFVFLRTLPASAGQLFDLIGVIAPRSDGIDFITTGTDFLIVSPADNPEILAVYDSASERRLELSADLTQGFRTAKGMEFPAAGLRVLGFSCRASRSGERIST